MAKYQQWAGKGIVKKSIGKPQTEARGQCLQKIGIDHCIDSPRLFSREMAGLSRFATSLMSLKNAN
jgi:hypothetical protein